jgi:ACS family glucarate transporter-like MFS transporter
MSFSRLLIVALLFNISATEMAPFYSAFILGYALLMIPGAGLQIASVHDAPCSWWAHLSAILTAMTIVGAKPGLGTVLGIVPALFMIRLGLGFVTAPLYPACARTTANWIPRTHHAWVQGFVIAGSSVGPGISPIVLVWLMARVGWRGGFGVGGDLYCCTGYLLVSPRS